MHNEDDIKFDNVEEFSESFDKKLINNMFIKSINGYHFVNTSPVNETIWESINELIFKKSNIEVLSTSNGSHLSGMDINSSIGKISNKSSKYSKNQTHFDISSYRLTTVCSEKNCGDVNEIVKEINDRKNFDLYSFLIRDENIENKITYNWLLIPSKFYLLDPASYEWSPLIGKKGKGKNVQIGWQTNEINGCKMKITFSMSSQLWLHIKNTEEIKKFVVSSCTVRTDQVICDYITLYDRRDSL